MNLIDNIPASYPIIDQEVLLHRMTNRIRQSLELVEILTATVSEIRAFLSVERVIIYRFHTDNSGEVMAESIDQNRLPSLLGLNFPADDIPAQSREAIRKTRQRSIVNVLERQIALSPLDCYETGEPLKTINIQYRPADHCHIQYLTAMGVKFSLSVPILHGDQLWGLLVSHHSESRFISEQELQVIQRVVDQVSLAIAQATLFSQTREQAEREATINRVATLLHAQPTVELQAALAETVAIFKGSGGRLYVTVNRNGNNIPVAHDQPAELYICGEQPNLKDGIGSWELGIESRNKDCPLHISPSVFSRPEVEKIDIWTITDLYKDAHFQDIASAFQLTHIKGLLIIPLQYRQQFLGTLTIFRDEINTETLWAGHFDTDKRQLHPRKSFQAWRELKSGQAHHWTNSELEMAQALGNHFAMAIQQYQLYQQVQMLNANLELQVEERTAQLQQSLEFARVFKQVTDQIRSTLDLATILQTIVKEVRNLLNTDRVLIYQFTSTWQRDVVVEDVAAQWLSLSEQPIPKDYFSKDDVYLHEREGLQVINNVAAWDLSPYHRYFLQKIQVQAKLVVPIRMGKQLWGLLIAHECRAPRVWQSAEIELLQQLATEAAIAIHQAELYKQSRNAAEIAQDQAQQLSTAFEELKATQSQLIQTEKMSSLGQLVAGIAHEINNPVNFIYGNLNYVEQYTQDLLKVLNLYQQYYPAPAHKIVEESEEIDLEFLVKDLPKMLTSMKVGADRIRQLVLSLRNFSRLDQADRKPVDIHEGIDSTLLILQHRLKAKGNHPTIMVVKEYGDLPPVECYAGQLNQVFMNVIGNAIDALEYRDDQRTTEEMKSSPSQITIRTEIIQNQSESIPSVAIRILDNGIGISPEVKDKIFNPFFTTKAVGKGTGLGLSISYQIVVEKHGGIFECNSQPGEGTEFLIVIPIK